MAYVAALVIAAALTMCLSCLRVLSERMPIPAGGSFRDDEEEVRDVARIDRLHHRARDERLLHR